MCYCIVLLCVCRAPTASPATPIPYTTTVHTRFSKCLYYLLVTKAGGAILSKPQTSERNGISTKFTIVNKNTQILFLG